MASTKAQWSTSYGWILRLGLLFNHIMLSFMTEPVCQWEKFEASCGQNEVIIMETARYGRMRAGRCFQSSIGCSANVINAADQKCSGRRTCEVTVPNPEFEKAKPCKDLQNYFEGSFSCLRVEGATEQSCISCDYVKLTSQHGYIASLTTEETGCGSADCPWLIEADPGQRIRIKLHDFSHVANTKSAGLGMCRVYAVLKEEATRKSVTICGGDERVKDVYTTNGNSLEVRILGKTNQEQRMYFLLQYEVLGCGTMKTTPGMTFSRQGEQRATVYCETSGETWHVSCNGTHWKGEIGHCEKPSTSIEGEPPANMKFSFGVSIVIIIIIALVIGALILVLGLVCFRRRSSPPPPRPQGVEVLEEPPYSAHMRPGDMPYHREPPQPYSPQNKVPPASFPYPGMRNEYTHVWERPLPQPKIEQPPQDWQET